MIKRCLFVSALLLTLPSLVRAQALAAASRGGIIQVGGGYTNANSDYSPQRIAGYTIFGTFDFTKHLGVEADIHQVSVRTPSDYGENSYEAGVRYVYRKGRFEPYAKGLAGIASFVHQGNDYTPTSTAHYWEYSLGAGMDVRFSHHINVRLIDFEYQTWPTFSPNNLSPTLITVGVAYRLR